jgi:hypothetical protein
VNLWGYAIGAYLLTGVCTAISNHGRRRLWEAGRDLRPSANPFATPRSYPKWKVITFYVLVCAAAILVWPVLLSEILKAARENSPERIREYGRRSRAQAVPKDWLQKRISVEEAEAKHMVNLSTPKPIPFGMLNPAWREMVDSMKEGDELWEYSSSEAAWQHFAGRAGIALVRNGEVVDAITTSLN